MVNQTLVHPYHGILLSTKKEQTIDTHNKLDASPGDHVEFKRPIPKGHIPYKTFREENRLVVVKGGGGRGGGWGKGGGCGYRRATRGILVVVEMLCLVTASLPIPFL